MANYIAPGVVRADPTAEHQWDAMGGAGQTALLGSVAMRWLGALANMGNAVLFPAS